MVSSRRPGTIVTLLVSLFLLVEGAWGLAHPPALDFLPTNPVRATIHLLFGVLGLAVLRTGQVRGYLKFVGTIVFFVGFGWFIPVVGELIRTLLAVDRNGALINMGVGLLALLASRAEKHTGPRAPRDRTIPV
jgi:hypothetical protein